MVLCCCEFYLVTIFCFVLVKCQEVNRRGGSNDEVSSPLLYPNDFLLEEEPEYHHHHHHHPPNYYGRRNFDDIRIVDNGKHRKENEPDPLEESEDGVQYSNSSMQIPLEFIRNINQYNVTDLLLNFVEEEHQITNRFGDDDDGARSKYPDAASIPKAAGCAPELKTIVLVHSDDPSILYIPQCTRVERCGGCCSHTLLSCQPKETETLTYQVMKTQYTGGKKLKFLGKEIIVVEKHVTCKCDCKVKEEVVIADCNKYQEYKDAECRCACTNTDEEKKCNKNSSKKLWNPELCACQCRDVIQCTTGYSFDHIECRCMATPMKRRYANYDRRGYITEAQTVSSLDEIEN